MTTKLYPSIPPDYRLDQARQFQKKLAAETEKRTSLLQKNKQWRRVLARSIDALGVATVGLGSASTALLATGIGLPAAIPTAAVGAVVGLADLGLKPVLRRLEKKARRHTRLCTLSEATHVTVSRLLSRALDDGTLSDSEYQELENEREAWYKARDGINRVAEDQVNKLVAEFRERLTQMQPSAPTPN